MEDKKRQIRNGTTARNCNVITKREGERDRQTYR